MRVDYFHTGGPKSGEIVALDRVVNDGAWAGSRTQLVDATNLGKYLSRCATRAPTPCSTRAGSRRCTANGRRRRKRRRRTGPFTSRCASPGRRSRSRSCCRSGRRDNSFTAIWTHDHRSGVAVRQCGAHAADRRQRVDRLRERRRRRRRSISLVIGEGYTRGAAIEVPCRREALDRRALRGGAIQEPPAGLQRARARFCRRPRAASTGRTPAFPPHAASAEYNIFDSERYVLTLDNRALRDAAALAPYEFIEILVNEQTYGGGGIFNDHATASVDSAFSRLRVRPRVRPSLRCARRRVLHVGRRLRDRRGAENRAVGAERHRAARSGNVEMEGSGHRRARRCRRRGRRRSSRITADRFRSAAARSGSATRRKRRWTRSSASSRPARRSSWAAMKYSRVVGAFEGAGYEARGLYRPEADCIMFTRDPVGLLPRVPARDRPDHRPLRAVNHLGRLEPDHEADRAA